MYDVLYGEVKDVLSAKTTARPPLLSSLLVYLAASNSSTDSSLQYCTPLISRHIRICITSISYAFGDLDDNVARRYIFRRYRCGCLGTTGAMASTTVRFSASSQKTRYSIIEVRMRLFQSDACIIQPRHLPWMISSAIFSPNASGRSGLASISV